MVGAKNKGRPSAKIWVKSKGITILTAKIYPKSDGRAVIRLPPGFLNKAGNYVTLIIIEKTFDENEDIYYGLYKKIKSVIGGEENEGSSGDREGNQL